MVNSLSFGFIFQICTKVSTHFPSWISIAKTADEEQSRCRFKGTDKIESAVIFVVDRRYSSNQFVVADSLTGKCPTGP